MPTPLDMTRRTQPPAAARTPSPPPASYPGPIDIAAYIAAVRSSDLHANARLVALILATLADQHTGLIPDGRQPTLRDLCAATRLSVRHLATSLTRLEDGGWLIRRSEGDPRFRLGRPTH